MELILQKICIIRDPAEQAEIIKDIFCAYACKEKGMSTTGWPQTGPTRTGTPLGDVLGGLWLTIGILGAIQGRSVTGQGQKVDIALIDAAVATMETLSADVMGMASGFINTGGQIAGFVAPLLIGYLIQVTGGSYQSAFTLMEIGLVAAGILILFIKTKKVSS